MIQVILAIHILVSLGIILLVLLHRGEGTGLSSTLGGSSSYIGTTVIEKYLDRITITLSVVWAVTTLILVLYWR